MERIVIEVDDATAKQWQDTSPEIKRGLEKNFQEFIEKISYETKVAHFESLLDKASDEAARNGLTEEILKQLLNDE
jgi:hypothetical protein